MNMLRNKIIAITIATFFILSMTASMTLIPSTEAHTPPYTITAVYSYCIVAPNVIGTGQTVDVDFWANNIPPTAVGETGDRWTFMVNVTAPDGTQSSLEPFTSDPVGGTYTTFVPTQTGNYTFTATVEQHKITGADPNGYAPNWGPSSTGYASVNDTYVAATSIPATLVVQSAPVATWPAAPLPTSYWTTPIDAQNREWWTITGDWLETHGFDGAGTGAYYKGGGYNPYTTGPQSAHILWTDPLEIGGLMGGSLSQAGGVGNFYTGMSYEMYWGTGYGPFIIDGRIYYNTPQYAAPAYGSYCLDLATGKQIWYQNYTITNAQIYNYISPNQYGGIPYLWSITGASYTMYDANTGNQILSFTKNIVAGGTQAYSPTDGSILVYLMGGSGTTRWLAMWNSSLAIWASMPNLYASNNYWLWRPNFVGNNALNWALGVQWNVTEPAISGTPAIERVDLITSNVVVCEGQFANTDGTTTPEDVAYSAVNGALLWGPFNRTALPGSIGISTADNVLTGIADGVYVEYTEASMSFIGYSATNGTQLWGPTPASPTVSGWASYGAFRDSWVGNGFVYLVGMDGYIHALNIYTGKWAWDFSTGSSGLETDWGNWPMLTATYLGGALGTDGLNIYAVGGHTHLQPIYRGAQLYAVNGTSGSLLWSIEGWWETGAPAGADGDMIAVNGYDNQLYCFGIGNSQTTVEAPMTAVTAGTNVVIQGTVTDRSPGETGTGVPAAGTPAISDASMSQWMEYLYMQQPKPTNATGVPVTLTAIDPNGNYITIGNTTSDTSSSYSVTWTPPSVPGTYKITATFAGSNSYYASSAETAIVVQSPTVTSAPTATPTSVANTYFVPATAGLFVLIIVVAIVLALLMLRKKA